MIEFTNMTHDLALCCVTHTSVFVATQRDTEIDLGSVPYVAVSLEQMMFAHTHLKPLLCDLFKHIGLHKHAIATNL